MYIKHVLEDNDFLVSNFTSQHKHTLSLHFPVCFFFLSLTHTQAHTHTHTEEVRGGWVERCLNARYGDGGGLSVL